MWCIARASDAVRQLHSCWRSVVIRLVCFMADFGAWGERDPASGWVSNWTPFGDGGSFPVQCGRRKIFVGISPNAPWPMG